MCLGTTHCIVVPPSLKKSEYLVIAWFSYSVGTSPYLAHSTTLGLRFARFVQDRLQVWTCWKKSPEFSLAFAKHTSESTFFLLSPSAPPWRIHLLFWLLVVTPGPKDGSEDSLQPYIAGWLVSNWRKGCDNWTDRKVRTIGMVAS
jgi:hypothetical protein